MILEIRKYPDPILRKKCLPVTELTSEIKELGKNMIETVVVKGGVGLAAPQVGELKRIIAVGFTDGPRIFINPRILNKSKKAEIMEEGCLSFPGTYLNIKRAKEVEIEALAPEGEKVRLKISGLIARIFQHEIEHLDGILFIDKIGFWQRLKLKLKS